MSLLMNAEASSCRSIPGVVRYSRGILERMRHASVTYCVALPEAIELVMTSRGLVSFAETPVLDFDRELCLSVRGYGVLS